MASNGENGLSKTIADLERKAELLETENVSLKQTNSLNQQMLDSHEKEIAKLRDDRDYYLAQNASLHTLLESAGSTIVQGLNKIKANDAREQGIRIAEKQAAEGYRAPPLYPAGIGGLPDGRGAEMSKPAGSS